MRSKWTYLYMAVDKVGKTIDCYVSQTRNAKAARRFHTKALKGLRAWERSEGLNTDKAPIYALAISEPKAEGRCPRDTVQRRVKYLSNVIETANGKLKQ